MKTITYGITKTENGFSLYCNGEFVCEYPSINEAIYAREDLHRYLNGEPSTGGL